MFGIVIVKQYFIIYLLTLILCSFGKAYLDQATFNLHKHPDVSTSNYRYIMVYLFLSENKMFRTMIKIFRTQYYTFYIIIYNITFRNCKSCYVLYIALILVCALHLTLYVLQFFFLVL